VYGCCKCVNEQKNKTSCLHVYNFTIRNLLIVPVQTVFVNT